MDIYCATCNYIMIDDKEKGFIDIKYIEAKSEETAGEIYEKLLLSEGKKPDSYHSSKGYTISKLKIYTLNDILKDKY